MKANEEHDDFWRNKNVLVTGGAGFIGSWLVEKLVQLGAKVTVLDNLHAGKLSNLRSVFRSIIFIKNDIRKYEAIRHIVKNKDYIFHLAANASVPRSVDNPDYDFDTNAKGTYNILKAVLKAKLTPHIIYASTAAVYGDPINVPIDEKHPLNPISPYGASKLSGEAYCYAFYKAHNLKTVSLRIFNVYGSRQPRYVVHDFLRKLSENSTKLQILGTGKQVRDFVFVTDVVHTFLHVAMEDQAIGQAINIGTGKGTSIKKLACLLIELLDLNDVRIVPTGESWIGDAKILIADISLARNIINFRPTIFLKEGLQLQIDCFKKSKRLNGQLMRAYS